jgi:D-alanyl-D-alanine carboxypeptidase
VYAIAMKLQKKGLVLLVVIAAVAGAIVWSQKDTKNTHEVKIKEVNKQSQVKLPGSTIVKGESHSTIDPTSLWVVVSKKYPLSDKGYRPTDLVLPKVAERADKSDDEKSVRLSMAPALEQMLGDAGAAGHKLMLASGFRTYEQQQIYFDSYTAQFGREAANKFSALPGESEHQTGLALDIAYQDMHDCYLDVCFGERPAGRWLAANAYKYGFTLRYPADKTAITQYQYEPWHFRFVGKELALALHKSGLTLDEAKPYLDR